MFYVVYGDDFEKRKAKRDTLIETLKKKRPAAEIFSIEGGNFRENEFPELLSGQGLFERKFIILGKQIFRSEDTKELFQKSLKAIKESQNVFVFEEDDLPKTTVAKFKKYAQQIFGTSLKGSSAKIDSTFDRFALTDALGKRDKKMLWVLFRKTVEADIRLEEIHGLLFWQWKSMTLASKANNANEAGMKEYPYQKAKAFSKNYSDTELFKLRSEFVALYHDAHRGIFTLEEGMERFILDL